MDSRETEKEERLISPSKEKEIPTLMTVERPFYGALKPFILRELFYFEVT
jgi:hypothetical protein